MCIAPFPFVAVFVFYAGSFLRLILVSCIAFKVGLTASIRSFLMYIYDLSITYSFTSIYSDYYFLKLYYWKQNALKSSLSINVPGSLFIPIQIALNLVVHLSFLAAVICFHQNFATKQT